MSSRKPEAILRRDASAVFGAALDAVEPGRLVRQALEPHLGGLRVDGRVVVVGFGKAAAAMARGVDQVLGSTVTGGVLVVPHGTDPGGLPGGYRVLFAGHPVADPGSVQGARAVLDLARSVRPGDRLIALVSGGGSALLALPPPGVGLADIAAVTDLLGRTGAPIAALNAVRKHLDLLKGGRLAMATASGTTLTLILSDVPGDAIDVVASGPLAADSTTFAEALAIVEGLGKSAPVTVLRHLTRGARGEIDDSPSLGHPCFDRVTSIVVGSPTLAASAACAAARQLGYGVEAGPTAVRGDVREVSTTLTSWIHRRLNDGPACLVSAGETTVFIRGHGVGGRNQQLALESAAALEGLPSVLVGALATDGIDGPTEVAGALVTGTTNARARAAGFDVAARLRDNDAYPVLAALDDLLATGPTGTNVADIHLALVG